MKLGYIKIKTIMKKPEIKTIKVVGKTSDACWVDIFDKNDNSLLKEEAHHDYVPKFLDTDGDGYGDYIQIEIDFETGKILNWEKQKKYVHKFVADGKIHD